MTGDRSAAATAAVSGEPPIFLVGAARSGTTLAVDMLGLHSELSPLYETYCVTHIAALLFQEERLPPQQLRTEVMDFMNHWTEPLPLRDIPGFKGENERFHHGPNHLLFSKDFAMQRTRHLLLELTAGQSQFAVLRRLCDALFTEHLSQHRATEGCGRKRLIVNKTPSYVDILPLLAAMYPRCKVLHCVRDGRDVACSVLARPWGPSSVGESAAWWASKAGQASRWGEGNSDRYLEVRYEDLLRQPRKELPRVLAFLGVADETEAILSRYGAGKLSLDAGRAGAWRRQRDHDFGAFLRGEPGELLRRFGYLEPHEAEQLDLNAHWAAEAGWGEEAWAEDAWEEDGWQQEVWVPAPHDRLSAPTDASAFHARLRAQGHTFS